MRTNIILELGCNHQGDMGIAMQMIDEAKKLGVCGVKFQKRDLDSMPDHLKHMPRDPATSFGSNYYDHRAFLEFSTKQLSDLKVYAEDRGLLTVVSVFDVQSLKDALWCGFNNIKLPSQLYSNYELNIELLKLENKNTFVSTGMHSIPEVINWQFFDKMTVTMFCRSVYPCTLKEVNVCEALIIRSCLKDSILGYSSHEKDCVAVPYMILYGAQYIERHFTLDKTMKGSDHRTVSSTPKEIAELKEKILENEEIVFYDTSYLEKEEKIKKAYRSPY